MASVRIGIESARKVVDEAYKAIEELEKKFADIDFAAVLTSVENDINNAKTGLCESFEGEFAADIEQIKAKAILEVRKYFANEMRKWSDALSNWNWSEEEF